MILSIQVAMVASFISSLVAAFSHKFDDGFIGKIALSCIGLFSFFGLVNLYHGIIPEDAIIGIELAAISLIVRQYGLEVFNIFKPKLMAFIKHEQAKIAAKGHK